MIPRGATAGIALLAAALITVACTIPGSSPSRPAEEKSAAPAAVTPAPPQGGVARGVVRYSDGRPLAGASVIAIGKEYQAEVVARTGPDGAYSLQIGQKDANWRLAAWAEPDHPAGSGRRYAFPLAPVGDPDTSFYGANGISKDFVWRLSGPAPWGAHLAADHKGFHIGAPIDIYVFDPKQDPTALAAISAPAGSTIELALTPTDKLIDGSTGAPGTRAVTLRTATGRHTIGPVGTILDVPVGRYAVTGRMVIGGATRALKLGITCAERTACPLIPDVLRSSATLDFPPRQGTVHPRPFQQQPASNAMVYVQLDGAAAEQPVPATTPAPARTTAPQPAATTAPQPVPTTQPPATPPPLSFNVPMPTAQPAAATVAPTATPVRTLAPSPDPTRDVLYGRVTDARGVPIPLACITWEQPAYGACGPTDSFGRLSDPNGNYVFDLSAAGMMRNTGGYRFYAFRSSPEPRYALLDLGKIVVAGNVRRDIQLTAQ